MLGTKKGRLVDSWLLSKHSRAIHTHTHTLHAELITSILFFCFPWHTRIINITLMSLILLPVKSLPSLFRLESSLNLLCHATCLVRTFLEKHFWYLNKGIDSYGGNTRIPIKEIRKQMLIIQRWNHQVSSYLELLKLIVVSRHTWHIQGWQAPWYDMRWRPSQARRRAKLTWKKLKKSHSHAGQPKLDRSFVTVVIVSMECVRIRRWRRNTMSRVSNANYDWLTVSHHLTWWCRSDQENTLGLTTRSLLFVMVDQKVCHFWVIAKRNAALASPIVGTMNETVASFC